MRTLIALLLLTSAAYGQIYSDVDLMAIKVQSPVPGTNWAEFYFSPRVELGYQFDSYGFRACYWHFDNEFEFAPPAMFGLQFDVLDFETTKRIGDFQISGGFRIADESLSVPKFTVGATNVSGSSADTTQFGVTIAADGRTGICGGDDWGLYSVYGGRLSLLQGDWNWNPSTNTALKRIGEYGNDTQSVLEACAGVEACYGSLFSRVELEMQRWQSNALAFPGWNDLGFLGIGTTVGVRF